jgi:hypothetical protein
LPSTVAVIEFYLKDIQNNKEYLYATGNDDNLLVSEDNGNTFITISQIEYDDVKLNSILFIILFI